MSFLARNRNQLIGCFTRLALQESTSTVKSSPRVLQCSQFNARPCSSLPAGANNNNNNNCYSSKSLPNIASSRPSTLLFPTITTQLLSRTAAFTSNTMQSLCCSAAGVRSLHTSNVCQINSLLRMHKMGPRPKPLRKKCATRNVDGVSVPMMKGVVLKTLVRKPKKPNSANRKCVLVRLTNGKEMMAYVPGEGHTLQEHNVVMVINKRLRDTPGVKLTCVRGKYDLGHVIKRVQT